MTRLSVTFLWQQMTDFLYLDRPVRQQGRFFRAKGDLPNNYTDVEEIHDRRESIVQATWWGLAELESSKEMIFPAAIARKIRVFLPMNDCLSLFGLAPSFRCFSGNLL